MITLYMEKLYRYARRNVPLGVCIPVKKGRLYSADEVTVWDGPNKLLSQAKITSKYEDGSIRFLYTRFLGNMPGNKKHEFQLALDKADLQISAGVCTPGAEKTGTKAGPSMSENSEADIIAVSITEQEKGYTVTNGLLEMNLENYADNLFGSVSVNGCILEKDSFIGPILCDGNDEKYELQIDRWKVVEAGPVCAIFRAEGQNAKYECGCEETPRYHFEITLTVFAGSTSIDVAYRLFNTSEAPLKLKKLYFGVRASEDAVLSFAAEKPTEGASLDSTGCGDMKIALDASESVIVTRGTGDLAAIEQISPVENVRTCTGISNYRTLLRIGRNGAAVTEATYDRQLLMEGNEHFHEVFYGTLFADRTDDKLGISATIFQAQQNYPKAVTADGNGLVVHLVPEDYNDIVMQPGMAKETCFRLFFHEPGLSLQEIDSESLIYQMPDRPILHPEVYAESGALTDVFPKRRNTELEICLIGKADAHTRAFGMLNFGDTIDFNYTRQGRGGGDPVWSNNEYDFPHACALMYARSGVRRFLDYCIVHAKHWMDVDVCHYSSDPLRIGGQIEHTKGHVINGVMVPSHEWVEGLIDYYHFTGDERGLETAIGIGENVLRLLDTPTYQKSGESNARETGWALRTLTALYVETNDEKWKSRCDWIVGHFREWREEYGCFVAPYTDNTLVRVGFMISVAVGSLMRYYRVSPSEELKELIVAAVDDIVDNCTLDCGLFYYKELPSLSRLGNNNLLLEALASGYELTGDKHYLETGLGTFRRTLRESAGKAGGEKSIIGDAMVQKQDSTKNFAQSFYPLAYYHKCLAEADMDGVI